VLRVFREYRRKMPKAKSTGSKALDYFGGGGAAQQQSNISYTNNNNVPPAPPTRHHTHTERP